MYVKIRCLCDIHSAQTTGSEKDNHLAMSAYTQVEK